PRSSSCRLIYDEENKGIRILSALSDPGPLFPFSRAGAGFSRPAQDSPALSDERGRPWTSPPFAFEVATSFLAASRAWFPARPSERFGLCRSSRSGPGRV